MGEEVARAGGRPTPAPASLRACRAACDTDPHPNTNTPFLPVGLRRVESIKPQLLANNAKTYWVPSYVKEKRFANWLENARDWVSARTSMGRARGGRVLGGLARPPCPPPTPPAPPNPRTRAPAISRSRFWGTPMPIWASDDFEEMVVVGSVAELEELTGHKVGGAACVLACARERTCVWVGGPLQRPLRGRPLLAAPNTDPLSEWPLKPRCSCACAGHRPPPPLHRRPHHPQQDGQGPTEARGRGLRLLV